MCNSYTDNQVKHKISQAQPNIEIARDICIKRPINSSERPTKYLAFPVERYVYLFAQRILISKTNELKVSDS